MSGHLVARYLQRRRGRPLGSRFRRPVVNRPRRPTRPRPVRPRLALSTRVRSSVIQRTRRRGMAAIPRRSGFDGQSMSKLVLNHKATPQLKTMKRVAAPDYYVINSANQVKVNEGFQSPLTYSFNSLNDLNFMASKVPQGGTTAIPPYKRFVLERVTGEFLITNSSLATMYVDIYDVVRKRDDPGVNSGGSTPVSDPIQAWADGTYHGTSGDATAYNVINSLPTDSVTFRDWFKVIRRNRIAMTQGSTHRHSVKLGVNKLVDTAVLSNAQGDIAGYTIYTMIVAYGQPASIPGTEIDPSSVTTAAGVLDVVRAIRYKFTWVQDTTSNMYVVDGLSSLTGEKIVSRGAGTIVDNDWV